MARFPRPLVKWMPTHAMRLAGCRAIDGNRLDKQLVTVVNTLLDRAEAGVGMGLAKSKTDKRLRSEAWDLHWSALIAARNALQGTGTSCAILRGKKPHI
jgi:hypothetical protein